MSRILLVLLGLWGILDTRPALGQPLTIHNGGKRWTFDAKPSAGGASAAITFNIGFDYAVDSVRVAFYPPVIYGPDGCYSPCAITAGGAEAEVWSGALTPGQSAGATRTYALVSDTVYEFNARVWYKPKAGRARSWDFIMNFVAERGGAIHVGNLPVVRDEQLRRRRERKGLGGLTYEQVYERDRAEASFMVQRFQRAELTAAFVQAPDGALVSYLVAPRFLYDQLPWDEQEALSPEGALKRYLLAKARGGPYEGVVIEGAGASSRESFSLPPSAFRFPVRTYSALGALALAREALKANVTRALVLTNVPRR